MALALYRKYRPATFAEVVGQEHVTEPLRTALAAGRVNHAYLFSGPRGCGKTSSARILARSLNCAQGPTPDPCGECDSCVALAPEGPGSVDVVELDAASHGGVDDARELRDRAFYAPANSRYRVFIIDEAHMVTPQGFNALLKIVEEPPDHLVFVFATTEPDKVLTTIRSRTHHYPFRLIPPSTLQGLLESICADEGVTVSPMVYPLVLRAGGGSARDTLSVLDQLLAGSGPDGVTYERAVALLGVTDAALIDDLVDALAAGDGSAVYGTVERLVEAGHDPRRFAADLLDRLRDLIMLRAVPDAGSRGLITAPPDELARMVEQAERLGPATLTRYAEIVHTGLAEMRGATAPRLLLELLCARMMLPAASDAEAAVLHRLEAVERRINAAQSASGAAPVSTVDAAVEAARPARTFTRRTQDPSAQPAAAQPSAPSAAAQTPSTSTGAPSAASTLAASAAQSSAPEPSAAEPAQNAETQPQGPTTRPESTRPEAATARPQPDRPAPAQPSTPPPSASEPAAGSGAGELSGADIRRIWPQLLKAVAGLNRPTQALLLNATVQAVEGSTLVLSMPTPPLAKQLAQDRRIEVLREALRQVVGGDWTVRCVHGQPDAPGSAAPPPTAPPRPAPARRSPPPAPEPSTSDAPAAAPADPPPWSTGPETPAGQANPPGADRPADPQRPQSAPRAAAPARKPADDVPLPPEPVDEDEIAPEYASDQPSARSPRASVPASSSPLPNTPHDAAINLLTTELGARRITPS